MTDADYKAVRLYQMLRDAQRQLQSAVDLGNYSVVQAQLEELVAEVKTLADRQQQVLEVR